MLVIRNVFHCKPGQAKALVKIMKDVIGAGLPGTSSSRVLSDVSAGFWTVVLETEVESLDAWEKMMQSQQRSDAVRPMVGYMDLVTGGHREIYRIE